MLGGVAAAGQMFRSKDHDRRLREVEKSLEEHRRGSSRRESELQLATSQLVQSADFQHRELQQRQLAEQRFAELHAEGQAERRYMLQQREEAIQEHKMLGQLKLQDVLNGTDHSQILRTEAEEWRIEFAEKREEARTNVREFVAGEEQRAEEARREVVALRSELMRLVGESQTEAEEARQAKQELDLDEQRAQAQAERTLAELRVRQEAIEGLRESHQGLEGEVRQMHSELGKVAYTLGQRDRELQMKDTELSEVKRSLFVMQDEMDEVNEELRQQGQRVLKVERSLRHSRDLGEQVRAMRDMLKESHSAMAQLCTLLERERVRREQCANGLKQQKVRTELLLQLLHHFKSRTNDLAPGSLLGQDADLGLEANYGDAGKAAAAADPGACLAAGGGGGTSCYFAPSPPPPVPPLQAHVAADGGCVYGIGGVAAPPQGAPGIGVPGMYGGSAGHPPFTQLSPRHPDVHWHTPPAAAPVHGNHYPAASAAAAAGVAAAAAGHIGMTR